MLSPHLARRLARLLAPRTPATFGACPRNASGRGREDCSDEPQPRCNKEVLAKSDCMAELAEAKTRTEWVSPFKHLIERDDCCPPPCPELPRFDDMYYKESDKLRRKYQQTWKECPECLFRPKKICCPVPDPPIVRRPRKSKPPHTACEKKVKVCAKKSKCPKIKMKDCCDARDPPTCKRLTPRPCCKKRCTPYPSFSECSKPNFRIPRPVECLCLRIPETCVIYAEMRKRKPPSKKKRCEDDDEPTTDDQCSKKQCGQA